MTNKEKTLNKLEKLYHDPKLWTRPSNMVLAKKLKVSKSSVFYYLKELKQRGRI